MDQDVNTPIIFTHSPTYDGKGNVLLEARDAELFITEPHEMTYSSIWLYYHPLVQEAQHQRLRTFDLQCMRGDEWVTVMQITTAQIVKVHSPCHNCWVEYKFEQACTSKQFSITNMNGGHLLHPG